MMNEKINELRSVSRWSDLVYIMKYLNVPKTKIASRLQVNSMHLQYLMSNRNKENVEWLEKGKHVVIEIIEDSIACKGIVTKLLNDASKKYYDKIVEITVSPPAPRFVYDLHVPNTNNYVVGMGMFCHNTVICCRLLQDYYHDGKRFLIVCPPGVVDQWIEHVERMFGMKFTGGSKIVSEGILQTGGFSDMDWRGFDVAIIDESHHFRNDARNRFKTFMTSFKTVNPDADIMLITATPVNNDVVDLVAQVRIIENPGKFRIHVGTDFDEFKILARKFDYARRGGKKIPDEMYDELQSIGSRIQRKLIVRTTSRELRDADETFAINGREANFQEIIPEQILYTLTGQVYQGIFDALFPELLDVLILPHSGILSGIIADDDDDDEENGGAGGFQIIGLYKRLESSIHSFSLSLNYLHRREGKLATMLAKPSVDNRIMHIRRLSEKVQSDSGKNRDAMNAMIEELAAEKRAFKKEWDESAPLDLQGVLSSSHSVNQSRKIDTTSVASILKSIAIDMRSIESFQKRIDSLRDGNDPFIMHDDKIDALHSCIDSFPGDDKILVFTQFKDTAKYIERVLRARGTTSMVIVHGGMAIDEKEDARASFCPSYSPRVMLDRARSRHGGQLPAPKRIMIATDSMSQSVNLQETRRVINYDLPWNPMIIYQRNGRARRVDNPNPVDIYNFIPDDKIDESLKLVKTLEGKLEMIARVIGLPSRVLSDHDDDGNAGETIMEMFKERMSLIRSTIDLAPGVESAGKDAITKFLRAVAKSHGWTREDVTVLPSAKIPFTITAGAYPVIAMFYTLWTSRKDARDRLHHGVLIVNPVDATIASPRSFDHPTAIPDVPGRLTREEIASFLKSADHHAAGIVHDASRSLRETKDSARAHVQAHKEKNKVVAALQRGWLFASILSDSPEDKSIKGKARKVVRDMATKELVTNDLLESINAFSKQWVRGKKKNLTGDALKSFYADLDDIASRMKDAATSVQARSIEITIDGLVSFRAFSG